MYQEKPCQNNLSLQYDFAKESLEVVIVLAIILQFLTKMKQDGLLEESLYYKFRREVAGFHEGFHGIRFHGRGRMKGSFFLGGTFQVGGAMISYMILHDYIYSILKSMAKKTDGHYFGNLILRVPTEWRISTIHPTEKFFQGGHPMSRHHFAGFFGRFMLNKTGSAIPENKETYAKAVQKF
jgi:hypothetical protein